jgi:DNA-binding CsgD family transcriptional regulator
MRRGDVKSVEYSTTLSTGQSAVHVTEEVAGSASAAMSHARERHVEVASRRRSMTLIVVDRDCRVLLDSIARDEHELRLLLTDDRTLLRGHVAVVVKALVDECVRSGERHSQISFFDAHRFVRITRLDGSGGTFFAVSVEIVRGGDSLSRAARKYRLTPREIDVLALILGGESATEIAQTLQIAETTVQGYYKRLLSKTQSRNRPAMVANVLDWDGSGLLRARRAE